MKLKTRLILFLGDPDIPDKEFREFTAWLANGGLDECLEGASEIRRILRKGTGSRTRTVDLSSQIRGPSERDPAIVEVFKLLRTEAGLTVQDSLVFLAQELQSDRSRPDRMSFEAGVKRFIKEFGAGAVVAAAHQLRNRRVHDPSTPSWPLRHGR